MTDIDLATGSNTDYLVALVVFWAIFVVVFLVFVRYVWPMVEHMYWTAAKKLYWALRNYCHSNRPDGRSPYNSPKGWKS